MPSQQTPLSDMSFGEFFQDIHQTEKRWVRATVKTYETTGTYIFLKLFKLNWRLDQVLGDYTKVQHVALTPLEWDLLMDITLLNRMTQVTQQGMPLGLKAIAATTPELDAFMGDSYIDLSHTEKRLVRLTVTTFDTTGYTYFYMKVFRKTSSGLFERHQQLALSSVEWEYLLGYKLMLNVQIQASLERKNSETPIILPVDQCTPPKGKRTLKLSTAPAKRTRKNKCKEQAQDYDTTPIFSGNGVGNEEFSFKQIRKNILPLPLEDCLKESDITLPLSGYMVDDEESQQFPFFYEESQAF